MNGNYQYICISKADFRQIYYCITVAFKKQQDATSKHLAKKVSLTIWKIFSTQQ